MKMNRKKKMDEFLKLIRGIEASEGYKIDSKARYLESTFKVLIFNYIELLILLQNPPHYSYDQHDDKEALFIESLRLFVNFLNSAFAFADQIRKYIDNTEKNREKAFDGEYQREINNRFGNDPLSNFIKGLRNSFDHAENLPIGSTYKYNEIYDRMTYRIVLFKKDMNIDLNEQGRQFFNEAPEKIDILEICSRYIEKSIFPWVMTQQSREHQAKFVQLKELKAKTKKIWEEM